MLHKERLLENLPSFFNKEEGSNLNKLAEVIGEEMDELMIVLWEVLDAQMVDTSTGIHLDKIGKIWDVNRRPDETDDEFRVRLSAHVPGFVGGGTLRQLENSIMWHLGEGNYRFEDGYTAVVNGDELYARFRVYITPPEDRVVDYAYVVNELEYYKAAGVEIDFAGILLRDEVTVSENIEYGEERYIEYSDVTENEFIYLHRTNLTMTNSANIID